MDRISRLPCAADQTYLCASRLPCAPAELDLTLCRIPGILPITNVVFLDSRAQWIRHTPVYLDSRAHRQNKTSSVLDSYARCPSQMSKSSALVHSGNDILLYISTPVRTGKTIQHNPWCKLAWYNNLLIIAEILLRDTQNTENIMRAQDVQKRQLFFAFGQAKYADFPNL